MARHIARRLLEGEFATEVIDSVVAGALNFPVPVRPLGGGLFLLELFHGPTLAFKDFGARFLARLFGDVLREEGDHATVLVATSGDTGSAVARGFAGVAGTRVVVLYPSGKVSPFQEAQMATIGGNVTAVRVPGMFDDCQRLVKSAFMDPELAAVRLTSANSINIGRLLPQTFYYVSGYLDVTARAGGPVVFSVPSGNLGNLTAGVMAARMGVPVARFVAATNANDVLPEYLDSARSGRGPRCRRCRTRWTSATRAISRGSPRCTARRPARMGADIAGVRVIGGGDARGDPRRLPAVGDVLDPHGAVACWAAERFQQATGARTPIVVLATAHPAKFADVIRRSWASSRSCPRRSAAGSRDRCCRSIWRTPSPAAFKALLGGLSSRSS